MDPVLRAGGANRDVGAKFSNVFLGNNPHPKEWELLDEAAVEQQIAEVERELFGDESEVVGSEEALRMALKRQQERDKAHAFDGPADAKSAAKMQELSNKRAKEATIEGKSDRSDLNELPAVFAPVDVELRAAEEQSREFERRAEAAATRVAGQRTEEVVSRLRKRLHEAEEQITAASLAHKQWLDEKRDLENRVEDLQIETASLREQVASTAGATRAGGMAAPAEAGRMRKRGMSLMISGKGRTAADKMKGFGAEEDFGVDVDDFNMAGGLGKVEMKGSFAMWLARIGRFINRLIPLEDDIHFITSQYGRTLGTFFSFLRFLWMLACVYFIIHLPLLTAHAVEMWDKPVATKICGGIPCVAIYGSFYKEDATTSLRLLQSADSNMTAPARNSTANDSTALAGTAAGTPTRDPVYALRYLSTIIISAAAAVYLSVSRWAANDRLCAVERLNEKLQPRPWSKIVLVGWDFRLKTEMDRQNFRQSIIHQLEGVKADGEEKQKALNRTTQERRLLQARRIVGILLNTMFILAAWACIGGATIFEREISDILSTSIGGTVGKQIGSFAPNLILSIVGTVLPEATKFITKFERWPPGAVESQTLWRLYLGKILNVGIVGALNYELLVGKSIFGQDATLITRKKDEFPCAEDQAAVNLVFLTVTEFVLSLALKPAQKSVAARIKHVVLRRDQVFKLPQFEVSDNAVDLIYFQGLLSVAMVLAPGWVLVTPILWFVHFKWLKRALQKLCSDPGVLGGGTQIGAQMRRLLAFTTALCVGFVYVIVSQDLPHEAGCGPFESGSAFHGTLIQLKAKGVTDAATFADLVRSPVPFAAVAAVLLVAWLFTKNNALALQEALQNLQDSSQRHAAAIENELKLLEKRNEVLQRRQKGEQQYN